MKKLLSALIVGCGLAAAQAHAACDYPVAPGKFPDGTMATMEELKAAKGEWRKYDDSMKAYIECIDGEYQASVAAQGSATPQQKKDMERVFNVKVDAAENERKEVGARLNKEISAYLKLHPPAPKPAQ